MEEKISISRPASGAGTVVTVSLRENGISAKFAHRTTISAVGPAVSWARREARSMLDQAKAEVQ